MGREKQKHIILIYSNDKSLFSAFEKCFQSTDLIPELYNNSERNLEKSPLLIIADSSKVIKSVDLHKWIDKKNANIIISSTEHLTINLENIKQIAQRLISNKRSKNQNISNSDDLLLKENKDNKDDPCINDFVENKLKDFVKRMKENKGKDLYSLLMKEFEKPLIKISLEESNGNQMQASELLGINRNTLRKKIKDLNISLKDIEKK